MPRVFAPTHHISRPQSETPEALEILRPSGDPFVRADPVSDAIGTIGLIDQAISENQAGLSFAEAVEAPAENPRHEHIFTTVLQETLRESGKSERSAEDGANDDWVDTQEYSHSTRVIQIVGELAVQGALDTPEGGIAKETLRERFESSVIEMLHTDKEFRAKLEINRERKHVVRGGVVMALDGKTSMTGITRRGARSAAKAATTEEAMSPVAARCSADERVAQRVEALPVGGFMVGLSVDPKEAMARYGRRFYEDKGFREELAFLQWYYRIDEHTLLAATYSVDYSDLQTWREVWAEFGGDIPYDESTDTWLDHDISMQCSLEEGRQMVRRIRARFYEMQGVEPPRYSVDEFMAINQSACDEMFESLYMNLTVAHETRQMDAALRTFVDGLLSGAHYLSRDIRNQLYMMRGSTMLEQPDIALLEQLVRYAITERLRTGLTLLGKHEQPLVQTFMAPPGMNHAEFIAQAAAGNVLVGARAGRTYGGCTKSINPGGRNDGSPSSNRPQDAFGGSDEGEKSDEKWTWKSGVCRIDSCPTRPNHTMVGPCSVCWNCQKKFDSGLDFAQIVKLYQKRHSTKVEKLGERVLKPFAISGLASLIANSKKDKIPAAGAS